MIPKDMLIYYGYLNSFNSATHGWVNEKVAQELAQYSVLVFGDGVQDPTHPDYANAKIIIPRIKELNPAAEIYGYVTINQPTYDFKKKVAWWKILEIHGIFLDEAGYDFGTVATNGRVAFNEKVSYLHGCDFMAFANAWKPEDVLDNEPDTFNPDQIPTILTPDDMYLLESHAITSAGAYEAKTQWFDRALKAREYDIRLAACSAWSDTDPNGQAKFDFIYNSALMWCFDAAGSSDLSYGAGGASKMWTRPDVSRLREPDTTIVSNDINKYFSYLDGSKLELDFTVGSESSAITYY